ncbi:MAG: hypothetical protein M3081_16995 [Gemmatimonadota bacterium]|nr:hypothetical protein [Gemmatimonadota bacterium]
MAYRPRSLRHEYELYVEREIEEYKESVPRSALLGIGDEAVASLNKQQQLALTELVLCDEVDRIISARLRVPTYNTWRKRRLKALKEFSRPERWGLRPDGALARTVRAAEGHVLVAGTSEGTAIYLAANGCAVTTIDATGDVVERVMDAAVSVGIAGRVRGFITDLASWAPDMPLNAVVCAARALSGLTVAERARALGLLQQATTEGGVHLLDIDSGDGKQARLDELRASYIGWQISVERDVSSAERFLARKAVA